ncbi:MAG TPA: cation diffusion facilitator family transporter [Anaerolineae bacterium]|nr:cation diffusion facilitator family transporter [Anaerolineae bacterium]
MVSKSEDREGSERRENRSFLAVNLGLVANILLAALKTGIGVLGHSPALLADGINSTSDVAYYVVVSVFMRMARKPPDHEHPYGHSQLESIAALVVGSFVVTTAIAIFWNSVNNVYELLAGQSDFAGASLSALWVALFTVLLKIGLTVFTQRIGTQTGNAAVLALGYDHRNDIFSAAGAAAGIFLGRQGVPWVDPLAGALVALVVLRTGVEILRQSSADLMDTVPGRSLAQQVSGLVDAIPGVEQTEEIHAHRFGPYLVINVTIGVDGSLSVAGGDKIASQVESALCRNVDFLRRVHVHYHPTTDGLAAGEAALPDRDTCD